MANVSLKWCPTAALKEWTKYHWYYLPESMETEQMQQEWMHTMQEILLEMQSRELSIDLTFINTEFTEEPKNN